ncbi:hypothetical protein [Streptomyces sp. V4I2]|uniref:hypothetical protein n=1 Tax=Streptomyces sp. V4I2 TaxID=3042280 RepID=UPI002789E97A|nr:hypothetical protein [Streptomyces sp. V4I2]MDQ1047215.1 hypothetical protein [Streptomyces sp. V4I2]
MRSATPTAARRPAGGDNPGGDNPGGDTPAGRSGADGIDTPSGPCVVFSLDRARSGPLLREARRTQLLPPVVHPWGALHAYAELLTGRPRPLAVLDVPDERCAYGLPHRVELLRRLAPVTVLVPEGTCPAPLLEAGATNVLARGMPVDELAARLVADQRWLARKEVKEACTPWYQGVQGQGQGQGQGQRQAQAQGQELSPSHLLPHQASQKVLLGLFLTDPQPWCCHDLTRLLGSAEQPLARAALRARMLRLTPLLDRLGLALCRTGRWGRFSYTVVSSAGHSQAAHSAA